MENINFQSWIPIKIKNKKTVKDYLSTFKRINEILIKSKIHLLEDWTLDNWNKFLNQLDNVEEYKIANNKSNNILSATLNHYYDFLRNKNFFISSVSGHVSDSKTLKIIYFGAPGTGKSYKIKEDLKEKQIPKNQIQQVTFHPEYDYASFVGGYKPVTEKDEIKYKFDPEIFTNIYIDAWQNETQPYYLVIEEINRGNCAEIFGDIFQLLDEGYEISPSNELGKYLDGKLLKKGYRGFENGKMKLPPNLNILATMNTSDQSLFPMDSAFKRRWDWEYIPINYEQIYKDINGEVKDNESAKYRVLISETESFPWLDFISKVNKNFIKPNENLGMDKCIGNYFIKAKDNKITLREFINKAIFYLWNDVFGDEEKNEENIFDKDTFFEDFFPIDENGKKEVEKILKKIDLKPIPKED